MICIICREEFDEETELFEHKKNICASCYQEEIRNAYGYEGDCF